MYWVIGIIAGLLLFYVHRLLQAVNRLAEVLNEIRDDLVLCWVGEKCLVGTPVECQAPELEPIPQRVDRTAIRKNAPPISVWETLREIKETLNHLRTKAEEWR